MRLPAALISGIVAVGLAGIAQAGQLAAEQEALSRNCNAITIDQCYRDGWTRLVDNQFSPQISGVLTDSQRALFKSIRFSIVEDRNALGASSRFDNGVLVTTISSSVGYHLALFGNAAALNLLLQKDLSQYAHYQQKVVTTLIENTSRVAQGESLLPTPSFAQVVDADPQQISELMNGDTALGMSAYFTMVNMLWVLAHETGHQVLGHTRKIASAPQTPRKPMEIAADEFASRSLVRMGYSVYPTIFLLEYFAAIEQSGAGDPDDYPPAVCRLANVFNAAWAERANGTLARDAVNQNWNQVMDQPALKAAITGVLNGPQCRE